MPASSMRFLEFPDTFFIGSTRLPKGVAAISLAAADSGHAPESKQSVLSTWPRSSGKLSLQFLSSIHSWSKGLQEDAAVIWFLGHQYNQTASGMVLAIGA
jgi:hypothetical protein